MEKVGGLLAWSLPSLTSTLAEHRLGGLFPVIDTILSVAP
jgi:hypothetical protein